MVRIKIIFPKNFLKTLDFLKHKLYNTNVNKTKGVNNMTTIYVNWETRTIVGELGAQTEIENRANVIAEDKPAREQFIKDAYTSLDIITMLEQTSKKETLQTIANDWLDNCDALATEEFENEYIAVEVE